MDAASGEINGQPSDLDDSYYADLQFTVADEYTFSPSSVSFKWRSKATTQFAKIYITDGTTTVQSIASTGPGNSEDATISFASGAFDDKSFSGTVHIRFFPYGTGSRSWLMTPFTITGTVAEETPACTAPTSVTISSPLGSTGWAYIKGETIQMHANVTGGSGTPHYTWQKEISSVWTDIDGAPDDDDYEIEDCTAENAGSYRCVVSTGDGCETASSKFDVKVFRIQTLLGGVYTFHDLTTIDREEGYVQGYIYLQENSDYAFKVHDGHDGWGNNTETQMSSSNNSNWALYTNHANYLGLRTNYTDNYLFTWKFASASNNQTVSVTYPTHNQTADKTIYFDNSKTNWSNIYYRIGNAGHNENSGMVSKNDVTKVAGTANFYQLTTWAYNNFLAWHFADNTSWSGDNSIYKTDGSGYVINNHTAWQKYVVSETITLSPTTNDSGTPKVWSVDKTTGMKTYTVTSSATNCTVTLEKCTNYGSGTYTALSSGGTVMPTQYVKVTVTPSTGHEWNSFSVSGTEGTDYDVVTAAAAGTPGVYIIMGDVTFTASCSVSTYDITYHDGKGMDFSGSHATGKPTTHTYGTATDLKTATKSGYVFGGWYDNDSFTGSSITSLGATSYTSNIDLYAKWEKDVYLNLNGKWATDSKYFAVYCWNNTSSENTWVWMELAEVCSSPVVYKATIPSNYYDRIIFVHKNSNTLATWDNKYHQSADLEFPDPVNGYNQYTLSSADGGDGGKAQGSWTSNYSAPTYTITFAGNGNTDGSMSNIGSIACDADQAVTANAFTKTGYNFAGWKANVDVKVNDETVTAGSIIANNATIQNIRGNITLTAQWSQIMVSSITLDPTSKTLVIDGTQTISTTVSPSGALDKAITWTTSDADVATVDGGVVTAVGAGTATITATAHDGSGVYAECAITVEAAASCSGDPTALVSGTLYKVEDMASACAAALNGTGQYKYGLSTNGKFYVVGTTDDNNSSTGTVEMKTGDNLTDVGGDADADFTNYAWLKMAGSTSHHSIKFVVPTGGGKLIVYGKGGGTSSGKGNVQIRENSTGTVTEVIANSSNSACKSSEIAVNAGIYYIYSSGTSAAIYGLRFEKITVPNVSGLGVDDGATLSSIPLSWTIPGICDLSKPVKATMSEVNSNTQETPVYNPSDSTVTAVGSAGYCNQYGIAFSIPEETNVTSVTADWKINSGNLGLFAAIINPSDGKTYWEHNNYYYDNDIWNRSTYTINSKYWTDGGGGYSLPTSVQYVGVFANDPGYGGFTNESFSLRDLRYHVSGQNDIDHVVLMRKEGSAATGPADASATKLYEGTKSHYTDASDVTGKNYYYTVFAVHANGAVSTGVSTSLTLYTITYNAGANGSGTVAAGKKTHGIDFTLSSSTFTRDGFTQDGWSTTDGEDKVYELGGTYSTDAAITLYPHWVAVSGPVITNGNPANGSIAVTSDGSTPILSAVTGSTVYIEATPSTGYNFTSWDVYKTDDASTKVSLAAATASTTFEMPSYAVTVDASFTAKTYTVTLNGNGGSGNTANVTATYNSSTLSSSITNPTKTGYIFDGWYSGSGGMGTLIISSAGVLQSSTTYSDGSGNWANDGAVTLYAKWTRDEKTAKWGLTFNVFPDNSSDTRENVTITTTKTSSQDGTGKVFSGNQYYNFGDGQYIDINLASGYYLTDVSYSVHFDPWRPKGDGCDDNDGCNDVDTRLYINFSSSSTYNTSTILNAEPIALTGNSHGDISTKNSVASIPSGAQSARIFADGSFAFGGDLFYLAVERTAYDCTPSTVSFDGGDATLGTAPLSRVVCGSLTLPGSGSLVNPGYLFSKWNDGEDDYDIGDSYDVTDDVTFTAQWVEDNISLRIPGSVVTLNNGNDARMTGSDNSTIDIDGDGNTDSGMYLKDGSAEWDVYITPGVYNIKTTCCVNSYGLHAKVSLIDPAGLEDPIEIYNTTHISGEKNVYIRKSETVKKDFSGLTANKRYVVKIEDAWTSCHLYVKDIVFTPLYDVSIAADPDGYGEVDESSLDDVASGTAISASSNVLTIGATEITATATTASAEYTYSFSNWTKGDGTALPASVTSDLSVRANFSRTANNYTLTWDFGGGSTSDDDYTTGSVAYGATLDYPASNTMSKSGYDFAGWSTDASTMPAEALTITAQWAERFTVTYSASPGTVTPSSATGSTASTIMLPNPSHATYDFLGWYNTAGTRVGGAGDPYGPEAAGYLYAKWQGSCSGTGTTIFKARIKTSGMSSLKSEIDALSTNTTLTTDNYLSELSGGTFTLNITALGKASVANDSTISIVDKGKAYFSVTLSGTQKFQKGDIVTIGAYNNDAYIQKTTDYSKTTDWREKCGTRRSFVIPSSLVGENTFYIKAVSNPMYFAYIEVYRPGQTLFFAEVKDIDEEANVGAAETEQTTSTYLASISGGKLYTKGNADSYVKAIKNTNELQLTSGDNNTYIKLVLDKKLAAGDKIIVSTSTTDKPFGITTSGTRSTTITAPYTIPAESGMIGEQTIYLWRNSSNSNMHSVAIIRPNVPCYTVTYDGNGATSGYVNDPAQHTSGSTVFVSSGTYSKDKYIFNGWNTEADGSGTDYDYNGSNDHFTITGNTTLYAQWKIRLTSDNEDFEGYDAPTYNDVEIASGKTLTITQNTTVRNITVETGATLNIATTDGGDGVTFTAKSLHLKGGWNESGTKYDMPRVFINEKSSLVKTGSNIVNFDIAVTNSYSPFAVPFRVKVSDVDYAKESLASASVYLKHYFIRTYDGENRAKNGFNSDNWTTVPLTVEVNKETVDNYLEPGRGYALAAKRGKGELLAIIRLPMYVDNAWTDGGEKGSATISAVDTTKNAVAVTAWEKGGGATTPKKDKGWNILGVPYMSCFDASDANHNKENAFIKGKLNFTDGTYSEETKVYVSVPTHDFSEYVQETIDDAVLVPGWCFFVQFDQTGTLTFATAGEEATSELPIYAPKHEPAMPTVKTGIILSGAEASDKTTILVSDRYSVNDYEINADLEKLFGENSYTLATYSLAGTTRLAYNAMSNSDATNVIPIGYRAPADGEYTFAINPRYAENGAFEHVNLIDYETGFVTDLLVSSYSFATERTQNDERFALNVVKRQDVITDITVTGDGLQVTGPQKVIINDKLYIIVDGRMYSVDGALVVPMMEQK